MTHPVPNGSIGVLIPAYGAEATIARIIEGASRCTSPILVVDDGSTDATGSRARAAGATVMRHVGNRGKGTALATGFAWMLERGVDAVVTLDADGQHDPDDIPSFIAAYRERGADLIVGSRNCAFDRMSRGRRIGNRFSSGALEFFTGLRLPDSQSGYRLYAGRFLRDLCFRRRGYDAEMEVLMHAARRRSRIETIPVRVPTADGKVTSHYRPWVDTYRICRTVVRYSVVGP